MKHRVVTVLAFFSIIYNLFGVTFKCSTIDIITFLLLFNTDLQMQADTQKHFFSKCS